MSSAKATKKSAFSCEPCRRRKVKCGGEQPKCNRCSSRNDECVYKLNPTLSYTQRLESRIKELEDQLAFFSKSPSSVAVSSPQSSSSVINAGSSHDARSSKTNDDSAISRSFSGLKVDDKGRITYHGATSFFQLPGDRQSSTTDTKSYSETDRAKRERLVNNAWQQRALENLSGTPEPFQYLLHVHWCWIQPLFHFIYRPAFTRDMQALGPYYSHTLLNAVLSHSIRWGKRDPNTRHLLQESYDGGAVFGDHARSMVFEELRNGVCTIPTLQTLLLLSAQECSLGNSTQAWTYSGLAFRLMDHMGICMDGQSHPSSVNLTDEDVEIRRRIYWSSYFWDKIISLYLGRRPSLQESSASPPQVMFDDSAENDIWAPFGVTHDGSPWNYPPATAHSTSCFLSMCRLSLIFNQILIHMYDPTLQNSDIEMQECLQAQKPALQQWWDELPSHLKIDPFNLPALAPPSHIVTLNCLFHTFNILLYRPMLTKTNQPQDSDHNEMHGHLVKCVTSATSIIAIFDLFCRTYSLNYCVLSLAYSVYVASSIFLLQIQATPDNQQALQRLEFCIQCLGQVKSFSPVIGSALNLVMKELTNLGISLQSNLPPESVQGSSPTGPPQVSPMYSPTGMAQQPMVQPTPALFVSSMTNGLGYEGFQMNQAAYQTMSGLEPLSVRVGTLHESGPQDAVP